MNFLSHWRFAVAAFSLLGGFGQADARGLDWPGSRIFPRFTDVERLDVIETKTIPAGFLTPFATLQGLVNRAEPRIYLLEDFMPSQLWLKELGVPTQTARDPLQLIVKYRSEIAGLVIYDEGQPHTLNLATTIAAQRGAIVAAGQAADRLRGAPFHLPVLDDLRGRFQSKIQIYTYMINNFSAAANRRMLIGLDPFFKGHLRDYAMATNSLVVWLDPRVPEERTLLERYLRLYPPNSPYMGWWTSESVGVEVASRFGMPTYAADWSMNLTVFGGKQVDLKQPRVPTPPKLENKIYVATFMSDGDNVQEIERLVPLKWTDPNRGRTPISWTINPAIVDLAPLMLAYYQRTATANDNLVSGPSGAGYTYPMAWPGKTFDDYARLSGRYMAAAGLQVATVWNNNARMTPEIARAYTSSIPNLVGLTIQDQENTQQFLDYGIPLTSFAISYGDRADILRIGIDQALQRFDGSKPVFAAIQGNMNMAEIQPTAFLEVQQSYANNPNIVFVRADHFFHLMKSAQFPASHQLFTGDYDGDGRTDTGFYYAGNGDFWLGASRDSSLEWTNAGNTVGFGNLLDKRHQFFDGDFNGDGKADILFGTQGDGNWWLGQSNGSGFQWNVATNTQGFGNVFDKAHKILTGDFNGDRKTDLLVYYNGDGNWWLGQSRGKTFDWTIATNTRGFGNLLDGDHGLHVGDYDGDGRTDIAFYYKGDGLWWLGLSNGSQFAWHLASDTKGFGNLLDRGHKVMTADVNGDRKSDVVFYHNGDGTFWAGLSDGRALNWVQAAHVPGLGDLLSPDHRIELKDIDGDAKDDLFVYSAIKGSLHVGISNGSQFALQEPADVSGFGNLLDPTRALFVGNFADPDKASVMFHYAGDSNWWVGSYNGSGFDWDMVSNTSSFGNLLQ